MPTLNIKWPVLGVSLGFVAGLAISVPAHRANPILAAPGVFLGLIIACVGTVVTAVLLLFGKHGGPLVALFATFLMMLAVLVLLPLIWPYPGSEGTKPLARITMEGRK